MDISIRHAVVKDSQCIVSAEQEIAKVPGYFCSEPSELSSENVIKTISDISRNVNGVYLVAEHDGQIVGHAFLLQLGLQSLQHVAELTIVVHQEWQEKGIGKKLMQKLIEWAKNSPTVEKIQLFVRATNARAISLYKQMGFQEEGRLKDRVRVGNKYIDDLIMALDVKENLLKEPSHLNGHKTTSFNMIPASPSDLRNPRKCPERTLSFLYEKRSETQMMVQS